MKQLIINAAVAVLATTPTWVHSHPGHGLDNLWAHDILHVATAVLTVALVATVSIGLLGARRRRRRQ